MDFGRKGDNTRAMNLMWRKGVSLKDAWAIVQGRKKGSSKKRGSSRKNCFGVNSDMYADGMEINPATGRMRRVCAYGRNPLTGKCLPPRVIKDAPDGYEYNVNTGKFRKICEHGRNPLTNRCFSRPPGIIPQGFMMSDGKLLKMCKYGRDPLTGRCNKKPREIPATPPPGYEYLSDGRLRKMCTYGRDPLTLRCFPKPRTLVGIPEGYERTSKGRLRLICNPATHYRNARGRCVPIKSGLAGYFDAIEMPEIGGMPRLSTNPFDSDFLQYDQNPGMPNPFEDEPDQTVVYDEDDFDPFNQFGRKYKKPKRRTMRSCFGSCSSCSL